ncbi:MAG: FAD-dependent oxidoreductase [Rubrivivax sp.]
MEPADARRIWDMTLEGITLVRQRIDRHAIDCNWVSGQMHVANKPRHVEELRAWQEELAGRYTSTRLLSREEVGAIPPRSPPRRITTTAAGTCTRCATLGLAAAAEAAGARIHEPPRCSATSTGRPARRSACACAPLGEVRCAPSGLRRQCWLGHTVPKLLRRIMPVGTYIVATEPLGAERAAAADPQQRLRHRHELGARLLPAARPTTGCCSAGASATRGSIRSAPSGRRARGCCAYSRSSPMRASRTAGAATSTSR